MITAAEYRAWAEEFLRWAGEATTANERDAYIKTAEVWLQSAYGVSVLPKSRYPQPNGSGCCLPFNNGVARAGKADIMRPSEKFNHRPRKALPCRVFIYGSKADILGTLQ